MRKIKSQNRKDKIDIKEALKNREAPAWESQEIEASNSDKPVNKFIEKDQSLELIFIKSIPKHDLNVIKGEYLIRGINLSIHELRLVFIIKELSESNPPKISNSYFEKVGFPRHRLVEAKKGLLSKGLLELNSLVFAGKVSINEWILK